MFAPANSYLRFDALTDDASRARIMEVISNFYQFGHFLGRPPRFNPEGIEVFRDDVARGAAGGGEMKEEDPWV